jgi:hypothetical protein
LKKHQFGTFTLALKEDIDLNQLLFEHKVHHFKFKGFYYNPVQLLEIHLDDSKLGFVKRKNNEIMNSIVSI